MESQRQRSSLFVTLKQILKAQGIQYKQLAEMIGMSEPTVKRMFQEQDCKLSRLMEICDKIGLSFSELAEINRSSATPHSLLPVETERRLANDPALFSFFILLISHFDPEEIARQNRLDDLDSYQYLRALEALELIRIGKDNRVHLLVQRPIRWRLDGPLHPMLVRVNRDFIEETMDKQSKHKYLFYSTSRLLSPQSIKQLQDDVDALYENFQKQATLDQLHYPAEQLQPYKLVTAMAPFDLKRYFSVPKFSHRSSRKG